ncbi:MAG TPA: alpha/beta hydrolase [Oceanospirillaceae bacterium]|nr:alpha/beta hydrolase [Oceanospirillaceae bacterium]
MSLLDTQVQAFVDQSLSYYPINATDSSVDQQRRWYNALCKGFATPLAPGITAKDDAVLAKGGYSVPVRRYQHQAQESNRDDDVLIVFMHGGGFVVGGLDSHHDICGELAHQTGLNLVSVDYRLAPEHQYPADINDCLTVVDQALEAGSKVILVGDSAGGLLGGCVANARKSFVGTALLGQVLIYPALSSGIDAPSMTEHAHAPLLTKADMDYYLPIRVTGDISQIPYQDDHYMPMHTSDFSGLPPTHLFPAGVDPLRDDCELYAQALRSASVAVTNHVDVGQGLVHGHLRARNMSEKAAASFAAICAAVKELAQ